MKISESLAYFIKEYPYMFYFIILMIIWETGQTVRAIKVNPDVAVVTSTK